MTAEVKDELSRLLANSVSARRAEVASLLRFAGGLHIVSGRGVVEAEVDLGIIARRLRKDILDRYGSKRGGQRRWGSGIGGAPDRTARSARPTGAGAASAGGRRQRRRCRSGLAGSVFGARLADRTGPVVGAGGELPWAGGGAGARRCGAAAGSKREGARGAGQRPRGGARRGSHWRVADADGRPGHQADVG